MLGSTPFTMVGDILAKKIHLTIPLQHKMLEEVHEAPTTADPHPRASRLLSFSAAGLGHVQGLHFSSWQTRKLQIRAVFPKLKFAGAFMSVAHMCLAPRPPGNGTRAGFSTLLHGPILQNREQDGSLWVCSLQFFVQPNHGILHLHEASVVKVFLSYDSCLGVVNCWHARRAHAFQVPIRAQPAWLLQSVQRSEAEVGSWCIHISGMTMLKALLEVCSVPTSTLRVAQCVSLPTGVVSMGPDPFGWGRTRRKKAQICLASHEPPVARPAVVQPLVSKAPLRWLLLDLVNVVASPRPCKGPIKSAFQVPRRLQAVTKLKAMPHHLVPSTDAATAYEIDFEACSVPTSTVRAGPFLHLRGCLITGISSVGPSFRVVFARPAVRGCRGSVARAAFQKSWLQPGHMHLQSTSVVDEALNRGSLLMCRLHLRDGAAFSRWVPCMPSCSSWSASAKLVLRCSWQKSHSVSCPRRPKCQPPQYLFL